MATDYIERLPDDDPRTDCEWCATPNDHDDSGYTQYSEAEYVVHNDPILEQDTTAICADCARDWSSATRFAASLRERHA